MNGEFDPSAIIAAQLAGQPQQQPFTWGAGGRRMTPEDIARERALAARMSQIDYSPIASPWQGLARVSENLIGALRERKADRAAQANADYSAQIAQSLLNPSGAPSGSASPGVGQSSAPGGNPAALMQVLADPYADPNVKALAQSQLEQAQKVAMKQLEWANREKPEIVQLAQIANDPLQPKEVREAAQGRITALNDPLAIIPGLPNGTYVGPRSGIGAAFGEAPGAPDTLPPDFFDNNPQVGGSAEGMPQAATVIDPFQYDAFVKSMGKDAAEAFLRRQGISWGAR